MNNNKDNKNNNNDHNIPEDNLPNPVSVDNDLHIKDEVFDEEEIKKEDSDKGVFKDEENEVEDEVKSNQPDKDGIDDEVKSNEEVEDRNYPEDK